LNQTTLERLATQGGRRAIVGLALVLGCLIQGQRGLWEPDEGRYAEAAREMLVSGNYLEPSLDGKGHLAKPPCTYWAILAGMKLLGQNGWGIRLYLSISFLLTLWLVSWIAGRIGEKTAAPLAALIYCTMLLPSIGAHVVNCDALLTFFTTAGFAAYCWARTSPPGTRRNLANLGAWTAFGFAFLTKGTPALLFGAVPIIHASFAPAWVECGPEDRPQSSRAAPLLSHLGGAVIFLFLSFAWYAFHVARDPSLARYFLEDELVGRIFTGVHNRNPEWYAVFTIYGPSLLGGALPWTAALPYLFHGRKGWNPRKQPTSFLLVLWIVIPLIVFALSRSRLWLYLLPVFPGLAIAMALALRRALSEAPHLRRHLAWAPGLRALSAWAVFLLLFRAALWLPSWSRDSRALWRSLPRPDSARLVQVGVESSWNWGLDFYAEGKVEHYPWVQEARKLQGPPRTFDALAREAAEQSRRTLIIIRRREEEKARIGLTKLGIEAEVTAVQGGLLAVLIPGNSP
jgi:4-amino-4-deoxy-L-arabinose transferase-like glycosyltransferase